MRNIRIVAMLLMIVWMIMPNLASADETINADTNTKNTTIYLGELLLPQTAQASEGLRQIKEAKKSQDDIDYENMLAQWKDKQADKWANLPKGEFTINASAYTAAADECDKSDGITASGLAAKANRTIACPPQFPFGAKIKIAELGTFICEDRGGAIKGNKIDIFMNTKQEAFEFGRQNLLAQVVE